MRAFPLAWRGLALAAVLAMVSMTGARADDPSVAQLQVRLVESRQHLNSLYAQSAAASERLNGATFELSQAKDHLTRQRAQLATARQQLAVQKDAVAEITVDRLMSGSSTSRLTTMLGVDGPRQLLEQASAYSSTDEAMNARLAALSSRQVVYDSAARQAKAAVAAQRRAVADQKAAQSEIADAIARADAAVRSTKKERQSLLRQLADARRTTVAEVTKRQDRIDQRLDESGPGLPPTAAGPDDSPDSAPTTPPLPTKPPPVADPPPPSGNKVEAAIAYAKRQLGEPYVWGGAGPSKWDCSGLTMRAWQSAGVNLPHYAGSQYAQTAKVSVSKIKRGDLLFWSNGGAGSIYHVALYLGGGQMIHAPRPGRGVEIVPLSYWIQPDLASRPG